MTEHDEALLTTFLNASFELPSTARHHKMSLQSLMDWWRQPHIKAAIETLTEMAKARAVFIAANDATHAITALQSCTVLADADFYEQADPKTRHKAFESARKSATTVLRLAGLPAPRPRPAPAGRGGRGSFESKLRPERRVPVSEPAPSGHHDSSGPARAIPHLNGHANGQTPPVTR